MNSRSPRSFTTIPDRVEPVRGNGDGGMEINSPAQAVATRRALKPNGSGGVQMNLSIAYENDPYFEPNGIGGIQMKLTP